MRRKRTKWKPESEESQSLSSCESDHCEPLDHDSSDRSDDEEYNNSSEWGSVDDEVMKDRERRSLLPQTAYTPLESGVRMESQSGIIYDNQNERAMHSDSVQGQNAPKRTKGSEGSRKRLRKNEDSFLSDRIESESEKNEWSDSADSSGSAMTEVVSLMKNAPFPDGLSYDIIVSGRLSAQQMMKTKQFFYKSIVYTVYLAEIRRYASDHTLAYMEETRILYSLENQLSSKNELCTNLYKWIIFFCPFMFHRFESRFMNNVKRAYLTQKKNQTLSQYIEGALDMTMCSRIKREVCNKQNKEKSKMYQIMKSLKELKSMVEDYSAQKMDYSSFNDSELRGIINNALRKLSFLCYNVTELKRDQLIILLQYVTAVNNLLSVYNCVLEMRVGGRE